jgi:hypothetical protein
MWTATTFARKCFDEAFQEGNYFSKNKIGAFFDELQPALYSSGLHILELVYQNIGVGKMCDNFQFCTHSKKNFS